MHRVSTTRAIQGALFSLIFYKTQFFFRVTQILSALSYCSHYKERVGLALNDGHPNNERPVTSFPGHSQRQRMKQQNHNTTQQVCSGHSRALLTKTHFRFHAISCADTGVNGGTGVVSVDVPFEPAVEFRAPPPGSRSLGPRAGGGAVTARPDTARASPPEKGVPEGTQYLCR